MKVGQELDALVAEKVMGDEWEDHGTHKTRPGLNLPAYSTDIAASWEVVEKLKDWEIVIVGGDRHKNSWEVIFIDNEGIWDSYDAERGDEIHTLPHSICLAALKAKGVEIE